MKYSTEEQKEWREALPKKVSAIAAIILNDKDEVLIGNPTYKDHWVLIGGTIDEGESPSDAVVREVKEETGLDAKFSKMLMVEYLQSKIGDKTYDSYQLTALVELKDSEKMKPGDGEMEELRWLSIPEAKKLLSEYSAGRLETAIGAAKENITLYREKYAQK